MLRLWYWSLYKKRERETLKDRMANVHLLFSCQLSTFRKPQSRDVYFVLISDTFSDYFIPLLLFIHPSCLLFSDNVLKLLLDFVLSLTWVCCCCCRLLSRIGEEFVICHYILFLFDTDDVGSGTTRAVLKKINENVIVISVSYQCFVTTTLFLLS